MDIKIENLKELGYKEIAVLEHQEIIAFVKENLKLKNTYTFLYKSFNLIFLGLLSFVLFNDFIKNDLNFPQLISQISWGLALCVLLIPIHEVIHLLAYKLFKAPKLRIDMNLKKFYFMAVAPGFVVNVKEFIYIALAPFVVISIILISIFLIFLDSNFWFLLFSLFLHVGFCAGDFALLSYCKSINNPTWITYDDYDKKISYFLVK